MLPGYTRTDLKGLELGKEELRVLELKLKALIMDCIHLIDMVQQLLAADTRSTQEWQWQKQIRWGGCVCMCARVFAYSMCECIWVPTLNESNGVSHC